MLKLNKGYWVVSHSGAAVHRLVYTAHFGPIEPGNEIHHDNEDPCDNRKSNLKQCTPSQHMKLHNGDKDDCIYTA